MKTIIISIFAICLITGCTPPKEEIDIAKEEEAIKAVIENATAAWVARNLDGLTATSVTDETFIRLGASKTGFAYSVGWEDRASSAEEFFKNNPNPVAVKFENKNYNLKVYQESAWAAYEENWYDNQGEYLGMSINVRFLEKVDEKWKIAYISVVGTTSYEDDEENEDEDEDDD